MSATEGFSGGRSWTPSDEVLPKRLRGFQVAVAGDVEIEYENGDVVVWPACAAGVPHAHAGMVRITSGNTTATGIVVGY